MDQQAHALGQIHGRSATHSNNAVTAGIPKRLQSRQSAFLSRISFDTVKHSRLAKAQTLNA